MDDYPVHDTTDHVDMNNAVIFAQKSSISRFTIGKWTRVDLEDKFLQQYEENLVLKKHGRKQEEKITKMATKMVRLLNDRKKDSSTVQVRSRNVEMEEMMEDLNDRIRSLERQNAQLRNKLVVAKQTMSNQPRRPSPYGGVPARIQTGLMKQNQDPRLAKNLRVAGPPNRLLRKPGFPQYGQSILEQTRMDNKHLEDVIAQQNEQIYVYEQDIEMLKEQIKAQEEGYEEDLLKLKQQMASGQRSTIQENIDIIKVQREVKEKASKLAQVEAHYSALQQKISTMRQGHDKVIAEVDKLNNQLRTEQEKSLRLQSELSATSVHQQKISELQGKVSYLEGETDVLKEANQKLVSSAFDMERERQWRQRETALKVQIAQLEATLKSDLGEKGSILDKLNNERDDHENIDKEHRELRIKYFTLKNEHDDLKAKMGYFTKESPIDMAEIEEALIIVKKRKEEQRNDLDFLKKVDEVNEKDLKRALAELRAEFADTVNELEKTRNMLITQHKINRDYQLEVESVSKKMTEVEEEANTRLQEYARLLDIRAGRIRKLEAQLKDVAYGTRSVRVRDQADEDSDFDDIDERIHLERGQNLLEIHVKRVTLSEDAVLNMGDAEPNLFCTWEFYEYEIQATPIKKGPKTEFQFTSQYLVTVDDFFLHYLHRNSTVLELHQSFATDYRTVAHCQLQAAELLNRSQGRIHNTVPLADIRDGRHIGTLDYWIRLRVPIPEALRLYKERSKALGYLDINERAGRTPFDSEAPQLERPAQDNINELLVTIERCSELIGRQDGVQPSPYCVYKFFDFDDHDTTIVPGSSNPEFSDHKEFPVPMTADLDGYLKSQSLLVYVFDDTDPLTSEYLGRASIPLIQLAHDQPIKGIFELRKQDGTVSGTATMHLHWKYSYMLPHSDVVPSLHSSTAVATKENGHQSPLRHDRDPTHGGAQFGRSSKNMKPHQSELSDVNSQKQKQSEFRSQRSGVVNGERSVESAGSTTQSTTGKEKLSRSSSAHSEQKDSAKSKSLSRGGSARSMASRVTHQTDEEEVEEIGVTPLEIRRVSPRSTTSPPVPTPRSKAKRQEVSSPQPVDPRHSADEESEDTNFEEECDDSAIVSVSDEVHRLSNSLMLGTGEAPSTMDGIPLGTGELPRLHENNQEQSSEDSEGVHVSQTRREALEQQWDKGDLISITISHLSFFPTARILKDDSVKMLYISYVIKGFNQQEMETPFSLSKPCNAETLQYNFSKVLPVDAKEHLPARQFLASLMLPDDADNGRLQFAVVSEPLEDSDKECIDVGFASVSIRDIFRNKANIEDEDIPVFDEQEEEIGSMCVSVRCLKALTVINTEMIDIINN